MTGKKEKPVLSIINSAQKPKLKPGGSGSGSGSGGSQNNSQRFSDYGVVNGCFYQFKYSRSGQDGGGEINFPLCNFTCRIEEEVVYEDGLTDQSYLRISGTRCDGVNLGTVDVLASKFFTSQSNWPNEAFGTSVYIHPGSAKRDNLRACTQLYSTLNGDIPKRKVYRFTGWVRILDQWHYLSGSGAISKDGLIDSAEVDLGAGHMARYRLPSPFNAEQIKQAAVIITDLLNICPSKPHIGAALLAAVARAPLGECAPIDFAIWLHGLTGSKKSALAAIAQAFYGDFTARSFPANWSDSANDIEAKSHQANCSVFVLDDFKPSVSQAESAKLHAMAERLIRNTGNQAGRGRRGSDMSAKVAPFNRSMTIITGEDLPKGQSLLGRLLILELGRADVDCNTLTKLQKAAETGQLAGLMAAYIQWLAPRLDQLKKEFPQAVTTYRNIAIRDNFASSHPRAPEIYANLVACAELFLDFLRDVGALTSEQSNVFFDEIDNGLKLAFADQYSYQNEHDEVERFVNLLRALLSSGNGHIADRLKLRQPVTRPHAWGWVSDAVDLAGEKIYKPMGDCIGWIDDAARELWLEQNAVFKSVQSYARSQGDSFLLSPASLWRRLYDKGLIIKTEPDAKNNRPKLTVKRTIAGTSKRVMILGADFIESG